MTDPYRALCTELLDEFDCYTDGSDAEKVKYYARARAALALAEQVTPTDEDLRALWRLGWQSKDPEDGAVLFAEEVLARWGNSQAILDSSPQPAPINEILPDSEDVDENGFCWLWDNYENVWDWTHIRTRTRAEMYSYTHWLPYYALPTPEVPPND
jgi:hypothetical protein